LLTLAGDPIPNFSASEAFAPFDSVFIRDASIAFHNAERRVSA